MEWQEAMLPDFWLTLGTVGTTHQNLRLNCGLSAALWVKWVRLNYRSTMLSQWSSHLLKYCTILKIVVFHFHFMLFISTHSSTPLDCNSQNFVVLGVFSACCSPINGLITVKPYCVMPPTAGLENASSTSTSTCNKIIRNQSQGFLCRTRRFLVMRLANLAEF